MPYVNIKVTREGGPDGTGPSADQKAQLIAETTDLLHRILGKNPATTFVVINEVGLEDWGVGGLPVREYRKQVQRKRGRR